VAADPSESGDAVEARYVALLAELKRTVSVPVVMKLPPFFSSLPHFVKRLEAVGADGVSLFNRFFQPDIDLDALEMVEQLQLSSPEEALLRIRWIAILRAHTRMTLAATGGVYGAGDALAAAGRRRRGAPGLGPARTRPGRLSQILDDMKTWMIEREYESVAQLKGSMCQTNLRDASALARHPGARQLHPAGGVWR
jgi:dihydroorotate dehydrogenase (fumarate)